MPKLEAKQIQQELKSGTLWPVYWIYGQERMKSRELVKRIQQVVLGDSAGGLLGFAEEVLNGAEVSANEILDAAQSMSLGGGLRLIVVRDAHALKDPEPLVELFGPKSNKAELSSVCVFVSKDLDGRKKFSKQLLEKAAVVACEEVPEEDRDSWIGYLAKGRGLALPPQVAACLRGLEPWSLDIVDQELEKYALADAADAMGVLLGGIGGQGGADAFMNAFLGKNFKESVRLIESFADRPEEALPLLGLLAWNVRHLALVISGSKSVKISPFLAERFRRWGGQWTLEQVLELQKDLAELDFDIKQRPKIPLGIWTELAIRHLQP